MTEATKRFLMKAARVIAVECPYLDDTYYNQSDWVLESEFCEYFEQGEIPMDKRELLLQKPAMMQWMEYGRKDYVLRITKAGWKEARQLMTEYAFENAIPFEDGSDEDFWASFLV